MKRAECCGSLLVLALAFHGPVLAQDGVEVEPQVSRATRFMASAPLWSLPPVPPRSRRAPVEPKVRPIERKTPASPSSRSVVDPIAQTSVPANPLMPPAGFGFDVLQATDDPDGPWYPPDPTGEMGLTHFVAAVNTVLGVFDKTTGATVLGPFRINTLWQGFGGPCQTTNEGDPIVLYDQLADRWLVSQFTYGRAKSECVAVSQTSDPTGSWYLYEFVHPLNYGADYPKLSVWGDGYYMSTVDFNAKCPDKVDCMGAHAFQRDLMLAGDPSPGYVFFSVPDGDDLWVMLPSDVDGATPPPAGAPAWFLTRLWANTSDLQLWEMSVDWGNPTASTLALARTLQPTAWTDPSCAADWACVPQLAGPDLDSMYDRLLMRLAYRNFGTHQSLVTNHAVLSGGETAVRWYEIRDPGPAAVIHQEGTFAPGDGLHRWMGSAAMDNEGNLAIGYSLSGSSMHPDIAWAGRLAADPPGQLSQGEQVLGIGTGSQLSSSSRWGDYTHLSVDPVDDCTFWYFNEYVAATGDPWTTHVVSFKFDDCSNCDPLSAEIVSALPNPTCPGTAVQFQSQAAGHGTLAYEWDFDGDGAADASGPSASWSWGTAGSYPVTLRVTDSCDGGGQTLERGVVVEVNATCLPNLVFTPGSASFVEVDGDGDGGRMSPGERWRSCFSVTNTGAVGTSPDTSLVVVADNGVGSSDFCALPLAVGGVAAAGGTRGGLCVDFVVPKPWSGTCGDDVGFGLIDKFHDSGQSAGPDEAAGSVDGFARSLGGPGVQVTTSFVGTAPTGNGDPVTSPATSSLAPPVGAVRAVWQVTDGHGNDGHLLVEIDGPGAGDVWRSLYDGTGTDPGTADISAAYAEEGSGTWTLRARHNGGGNPGGQWVRIDTFQLEVDHQPPDCTAWVGSASCGGGAAAPPVADGGGGTLPVTFSRGGGDQVSVSWDASTCGSDHVVVLWGPLGTFDAYAGAAVVGCDLGATGSATFEQSGDAIWFNLVWVDGDGVAGHPGFGSTAARNWTAFGLCGVTGDDASDTACD